MSNHLISICGMCDKPVELHFLNDEDFVCERDFDLDPFDANLDRYFGGTTNPRRVVTHPIGIGTHVIAKRRNARTIMDYYTDHIGNYVPTEDYSGPEAWSGSDLAKHRIAHDRKAPGESEPLRGIGADDLLDPNDNASLKEYDKVANWNDASYRETASTKEWTCTSTIEDPLQGEYVLSQTKVNGITARKKEYLGTVSTESVDKTRNVFLDNQEGFTSVELLNLELTEKYQRKLLNVFADKNGRVRIGSIVLTDNADGTKTATCVRDDCRLSATSSSSPTREDMEKFVWAIVAHGNNHAAHWFTSRPSFHKVHRLNCDHAKCNENTHYCAYLLPEKEEADSLVDHFRNCKTSGCNCTELLMKVGA